MELNYDVLKKIISVDSPTGFTNNVCKTVCSYLEELGYKPKRNKKGNIIVEVKGEKDYKVGISAHLDTLGLMVRSINTNGTLHFTSLGGTLLNTYDGEYCKIYTRSGKVYSGTVISNSNAAHVHPDARDHINSEDNMHVRLDELVYSKEDTLKLGIDTGDFIAIDPKFEITPSGYVKTRFLDDKASAFVLLEVLRYIKEKNIKPLNSLIFMFTVYEEVGFGASSVPEMDELLAVDMGCIGLDLNCNEEMVSICAKDAGGPYDYDMITHLKDLAVKLNIKHCLDIYPRYSSDGTAALRGGNDIKCALIGPGICASHGMERTHKHSIEGTFKLIVEYLGLN